MITLYGISNCDTIKKTRAWLQQRAVEYEFFDYKQQAVTPELISQFLNEFSYEELINRRGTTWRKLPEKLQQDLNRQSAIDIMCQQPSIIKRPLLRKRDNWVLGFDEAKLESLIDT